MSGNIRLIKFDARHAACGLALVLLCALSVEAWSLGKCYFPPRPPVTLKHMGPCDFDPDLLSFAGEPSQQAACLLTPVQRVGRLGPKLEKLPAILADRIGRSHDLPARSQLSALLEENGLEDLGTTLSRPIAHAHDGDPLSRSATYFMIHDTSTPNYRALPWPKNIDSEPKINNLDRYSCANKIERAHVFINRTGAILLSHDLEVPWRATKFETATNFGSALKGLFLHVELIQPRRRDPKYGRRNDFLAPEPGFTPAQYNALALVYVVASVRAGFWLIPAFHAVVDEYIPDKHDDPQNFELAAFAGSLEKLLEHMRKLTNRS